MNRKGKILLTFTGFLVLIGVFLGSVNKVDPLWEEMDGFLEHKPLLIEDHPDSILRLFSSIHPNLDPEKGATLVFEPFVPTMELDKFKRYLQIILDNDRVTFSSVPGVGTTTLIDRITPFYTGYKSNILNIKCAPAFDLLLHEEFIGKKVDGIFQPGKLLQFFDLCLASPDEKFVLLIDDFNKINPETFFGPYLWEKLSNDAYYVELGGKEIIIPPNLKFISIVQAGALGVVTLNNVHFARIGNVFPIEIDPTELLIHLQEDKDFNKESLKKFIYSFITLNSFVSENFSMDFRLGQWSNIRKTFNNGGWGKMVDIFAEHVNALTERKDVTRSDFAPVLYSLENNGKLKGSNFFSSKIKMLEAKGFLTEFIVGLSFLLITGLISFYIFRKREKIITSEMKKMTEIISKFESNMMDHDLVISQFKKIKKDIDTFALSKKINYEEAIFFYKYFEDKSRAIEISKEANENFKLLVDTFLEDGEISQHEYEKLKEFLHRIKNKISETSYESFYAKIEDLYDRFGSRQS